MTRKYYIQLEIEIGTLEGLKSLNINKLCVTPVGHDKEITEDDYDLMESFRVDVEAIEFHKKNGRDKFFPPMDQPL